MLDDNIKTQLKGYLEKVTQPIEIAAALDNSEKSAEIRALLDDLVGLSDKISVREETDTAVRRPSFAVNRPGEATGIRFAGLPMGHEFTSLILALLQVGGHPPKAEAEQIAQIKALSLPEAGLHFETFISLSCHNCPDVVQALNLMALLNPRISHTMVDGALFQDEVESRQIMSVPTVMLNGEPFAHGRTELAEFIAKLDTGSAARDAEAANAKAPYDVLIIGGGPAGASAAIYAARKGIRTGIVADRFGGQVMDTLGIENFISVSATEGPKLVASLEEHVNDYDVDIMKLQRAAGIKPAPQPGGLAEVTLENGGVLKARSLILATGARWREMNVPGEQEYRGRGVAYCPHCDGPLFKGKPVAVIGGGNSGVEAAIDLAGIVAHVTVLEFAEDLKADKVLQDKLYSLPNVTVIRSAQTTEVIGADKVTGLIYSDRETGESHTLEVDGIFVQIGLLPNTDFVGEAVALSRYGEIEINGRAETSAPGIFAAGDCTTVPYKQIIIAMGEGSKAALSAFDYMMRTPESPASEEPPRKAA